MDGANNPGVLGGESGLFSSIRRIYIYPLNRIDWQHLGQCCRPLLGARATGYRPIGAFSQPPLEVMPMHAAAQGAAFGTTSFCGQEIPLAC